MVDAGGVDRRPLCRFRGPLSRQQGSLAGDAGSRHRSNEGDRRNFRTRPGCATQAVENTLEFLPDQRRIAFLSERDGWMHLYTLDVSAAGARPRQLTSGKWQVSSAEISREGSHFYVTANEVHPGERMCKRSPRTAAAAPA